MPAKDYVWIPGATFAMGADAHLPEEGPARDVDVAGFWIAAHEVTNAEFAEFVNATGYKTLAERSEEHTSELQSLMRISYAVFCLKKKKRQHKRTHNIQ